MRVKNCPASETAALAVLSGRAKQLSGSTIADRYRKSQECKLQHNKDQEKRGCKLVPLVEGHSHQSAAKCAASGPEEICEAVAELISHNRDLLAEANQFRSSLLYTKN